MNISIFDFNDYRPFLLAFLSGQPKKGHGARSIWARVMGCQVAFVSHVLRGHYDLNLEQAEALGRHLALNKEEIEFFLLLVQKSKAGNHQLKKYFDEQIYDRLQNREHVRNRMKIKESLSLEDQAIYYSSWIYSAVHILLTIPEFQKSPQAIANYFSTPLSKIREVLSFLEIRKLIVLENGAYLVENNYLFINKESPLFTHQQNFWRQKAIESIYQNNPEDIHFASVFTLAEGDVKKIKDILLKSIQDSTEVIKPSKEEKLYSICIDLFELR